jgi:hypothetical protein
MPADPLIDIARELYDLPPARFTAERNARARAVKGEDPALAKRISELRRATAPAWIVGQLVRHRADRLGQVLALGAELREAQQDLDASALAQLTRDRRALTAALAREGASLAEAHDVRATGAVLDEVAQTLQAAMADADAAAAVMSGRLVRALEVVGFDPVDLQDAVAGPAPDGAPEPAKAAAPADELAARRARREAQKAVREAEVAEERAQRGLAEARRRRDQAEKRRRQLAARREDLQTELATVEGELEDAETALSEADAGSRDAESAHDTAAEALAAARDRLEGSGKMEA